VLLLTDGDKITVGKPYIDGARVMATIKKNGKGDKIIVFKYKAKVRYRRKNGHRQLFTSLNIDKILPPGVEDITPVKKAAPKKSVVATKPVEKAPPKKEVAATVTPVAKTPPKKTAVEKPAAKALPKKSVVTEKPVAKAPVKKPTAEVTPVKKATTRKTSAAAKPPVKRTPRKKTEE